MALAEATHHTAPRGQMYDAMGLMTPPSTRPTPLVEVRPLGRVQRQDFLLSVSLVPGPQSAEQLVEVPTVHSPTRKAMRIAEQIVDSPVLGGRDCRRLERFSPKTEFNSGWCAKR